MVSALEAEVGSGEGQLMGGTRSSYKVRAESHPPAIHPLLQAPAEASTKLPRKEEMELQDEKAARSLPPNVPLAMGPKAASCPAPGLFKGRPGEALSRNMPLVVSHLPFL